MSPKRSLLRARVIGLVVEKPREDAGLKLLRTSDPVSRGAEVLARALRDSLCDVEICRLAIPGGLALEVVARSRSLLGEEWGRIALTWVDERCVSFEDAESNQGAAARLGLFRSPLGTTSGCDPAKRLSLYEDGEQPARAVERVELGMRDQFSNALDVVLLGLGGDGHIASLFPSHSDSRDAFVIHVGNSPKPPSDRISLTRRVLATARVVVLVAAGEGKRKALTRLVSGDSSLPAHGLPGLVVVTDLDLDSGSRAET